MIDLKEFRQRHNVAVKDAVTVVQGIFPKYDKMLQSKCENSDSYGVQLRPEGMEALQRAFDPARVKKKDAHRRLCRVSCRLDDADHQAMKELMAAEGYTSNQAWLEATLGKYIRERRETTLPYDIPDRPEIRQAERTGYEYGAADEPICPVCRTPCDTVYRDPDGVIVGCSECLRAFDAWLVYECFPEMEEE